MPTAPGWWRLSGEWARATLSGLRSAIRQGKLESVEDRALVFHEIGIVGLSCLNTNRRNPHPVMLVLRGGDNCSCLAAFKFVIKCHTWVTS
jgi:hypothetical protein